MALLNPYCRIIGGSRVIKETVISSPSSAGYLVKNANLIIVFIKPLDITFIASTLIHSSNAIIDHLLALFFMILPVTAEIISIKH